MKDGDNQSWFPDIEDISGPETEMGSTGPALRAQVGKHVTK